MVGVVTLYYTVKQSILTVIIGVTLLNKLKLAGATAGVTALGFATFIGVAFSDKFFPAKEPVQITQPKPVAPTVEPSKPQVETPKAEVKQPVYVAPDPPAEVASCPVTTCNDTSCSESVGRGTCSHHGGVDHY